MTINMSGLDELLKKISVADKCELVEIKEGIGRELEKCGYCAQKGEDPRGAWYLFLDAICDARLGAVYWKGGKAVVIAGGDLDLLMSWYDLVATAARSINQRQKDGRGGCNSDKYESLYRWYNDNNSQIERMTAEGCRYAAYLKERTNQIFRMHASGSWTGITRIEPFKSDFS